MSIDIIRLKTPRLRVRGMTSLASLAFIVTSVAGAAAQMRFYPVDLDPRLSSTFLLANAKGLSCANVPADLAMQSSLSAKVIADAAIVGSKPANCGAAPTLSPALAGGVAAALVSASWQDAVIRATAGFIESRGKATAIAFGVTKARKAVCESKDSLKLREYLRATCTLLLQADPFSVPIGWTSFQASFREDLAAFPTLFIDRELREQNSQVIVALVLGAGRAVVLLERGAPIEKTIKGYAAEVERVAKTEAATVFLDWATALEIVAQAEHDTNWKTEAAALAAARGVKLDATHEANVVQALSQLHGQYLWVKVLADSARARMQTTQVDSMSFARRLASYESFITAVLELMQGIPDLGLRDITNQLTRPWLETAQNGIRTLNSAYSAVRARNYASAFVQTLAVVNLVRPNWQPPAGVARYIAFATDLAQARDENAAASVLERFALPPGSYAAKRKGPVLGVNAYLGVQGSNECTSEEKCKLHEGERAYGAYVPLGLEFSTNLGAWSFGLFGTIIDFGTLLSERSNSSAASDTPADSIAAEPRIGLKQILAPGLFGTVGFPGAPFSIGLGISVVPDLRTLNTEGAEKPLSTRRLSLFGAVDLPLFRIR